MGNKNQSDIPALELNERGGLDISLYKMTTGLLLINNDNEEKHSIKLDEMDTALESIISTIKSKARDLVNNGSLNDFIDIGVSILDSEHIEERYEINDEPRELNITMDDLAEAFNNMQADSPFERFPPRGSKSMSGITGEELAYYLNKPQNQIKFRQRPGKESKQDRRRDERKKPEGDRSSNKMKISFGGSKKDKSKNNPHQERGKTDDGATEIKG